MEPLQSPYEFDRGKLCDPSLESLLRGLARQSAGLCLITTREPLPELAERPGVKTRDLEQITPQAGRALLRTARVVGADEELERLAEEFGPHALAVSLLGVYLYEQPGRGIGPAEALKRLTGTKPIDRVLAGFKQWWGESPETEALRLLGFFDRPADADSLEALRKVPAISGLNEQLASLDDIQWQRVLDRLQKLRLIHIQLTDSGKQLVDAHPLIREHFAQVLKGDDAWREGHRRLFEHLRDTTNEGEEPTLEDLQPLYQAVAHGCQAGLQEETRDEIYYERITRRDEKYVVRKLGAFGSDLGAVACFFEKPWNSVSPALTEANQAWLLSEAAFLLRALGRLNEALEPMRAGLDMGVQAQYWGESARRASNLIDLELTLGEIVAAIAHAEQSVAYAESVGDAFLRGMLCRPRLANTLHQAGRRTEAEAHFREGEQMQAERQSQYPLLYSDVGFMYCDLLLAAPERAAWQMMLELKTQNSTPGTLMESCRAVIQRAAETLNWSGSLLDVALDHLTLGRAALFEVVLAEGGLPLKTQNLKLKTSIDVAVNGLRRAASQDHIPHGILTRAWLRFLNGTRTGSESAQEDLDEAWEIAERGPMRLHMADIHLYRARLFGPISGKPKDEGGIEYPWNKNPDGSARGPLDDLAAARKLIEQCGYWRRKEELEDAEEAAKTW